MVYNIVLCLIFILILPNLSSQQITTAAALNDKPSITQFLVFSTDSETVIPFEPKDGWMLGEERKLRLYISGINLQNTSVIFSSSPTDCTSDSFISSSYPLSSATIIELKVEITKTSKAHSSIYLCLLSSDSNGTRLDGTYFIFLKEESRLPFPAKICLILMLFIVSGFFSGLNLGLMSLTVNDLRLIAESEDTQMRYYARRVLPLRKRGNFLLCSIVLANVLVNSLGTVLLDSLVHGILAVIGSTVMIVLMGEIIPQAICSRYGLVIGAHTHIITWGCMILTGIISYPLGFILDKILGQEVTASYTRDQIAGMLTRINADIEKPELDVITGLLTLRKKTVKEAMTWLPDVYTLDSDRKTDAELLLDVHKHGYSRIPVYSNQKLSNIIGIVKLRDFALITPEQYHLTVRNVLEFHSHPYGYAKTTDSLYNLMQEFLKARWHIAVVQELRTDEDKNDSVFTTVGIITLEDVIEELLQREIIEETDYFTDNRRKIQNKRAKTMDYTALVKRPVKGPSISPQLKIAVFQFLSTNVQQFSSGFISQEILKSLLNYNLYATIKRPANQSTDSIYLYKQGFRYELFTLVMQGNATLESGVERIMSTVGPFSFFAASALLAQDKTVKDLHQFLDNLSKINSKQTNITNFLDELSSIFIPDYNLIVNSELHILQIHRLVWLAAVRATQRQRSHNQRQRRMQADQLLSNAFDEISSVTNITIDKNNLTNFQRIIRNQKDLIQTNIASASSVFDVVHSLNTVDQTNSNIHSAEKPSPSVCNPLLLTGVSHEQTIENNSSKSSSVNDEHHHSNMHIDRIFDDTVEHTIDNDHGQTEHLIDQGYNQQ